ncbi:Rhomboid family intramembrane serine protease [Balamuthia mandrillaris]
MRVPCSPCSSFSTLSRLRQSTTSFAKRYGIASSSSSATATTTATYSAALLLAAGGVVLSATKKKEEDEDDNNKVKDNDDDEIVIHAAGSTLFPQIFSSSSSSAEEKNKTLLSKEEALAQLKNEQNRTKDQPAKTFVERWHELPASQQTIYALLLANTAVFGAWKYGQFFNPRVALFMQRHFLLSVENVKAKRFHTILSSAFSHMTVMHMGLNMYGLYAFGSELHNHMDRTSFLSLYLGGGFFASAASLAHKLKFGSTIPSLGASGCLFAVLWAYALAFPDTHLGIIFLPFAWPAINVTTAVLAFDVIGMLGRLKLGLDHAAHIGGALFGYGYFHALKHYLKNWNGEGSHQSLMSGRTYKGTYKNGLPDGFGQETTTKHIYKGEYKKGRWHGRGTLVWKQRHERSEETVRYVGTFYKGRKHGEGTLETSKYVYTGEWHDDHMEGKGTLKVGDAVTFTGQFKRDDDGRSIGMGWLQEEIL